MENWSGGTIFLWNNGPGGPNFHGEMVWSWKNGPPLENRFPVICIIYKDPNSEVDQFQGTAVLSI